MTIGVGGEAYADFKEEYFPNVLADSANIRQKGRQDKSKNLKIQLSKNPTF